MNATLNPTKFPKFARWAVVFPAVYPDAYMTIHTTRAAARKARDYENTLVKGIAVVVDRLK